LEWQIVFIIASVLFFFGNCVFLFFGSAVSQPWDAEDYLPLKVPDLIILGIHGASKDTDEVKNTLDSLER